MGKMEIRADKAATHKAHDKVASLLKKVF
jgi:hypothetical protein